MQIAFLLFSVQDRLVELGDTVSELITFDGYHVDGQQTAFDADLYTWFLQHTNDGTSASIAAALLVAFLSVPLFPLPSDLCILPMQSGQPKRPTTVFARLCFLVQLVERP